MKKFTKNIFLCLMAVFLAGCSNMNMNMDEEAEVSFSICKNERTAFPEIEPANLSNIKITYKKDGEALFKNLTVAKNYAALQNQKFTMKAGTYSFALTAEYGAFLYTAFIDGKKLAANETTVLEFTLNMDSYCGPEAFCEGDLVIKIKVPLEFDVQKIETRGTFFLLGNEMYKLENQDISVAISPSDAPEYKVFTISKKNIKAGLYDYNLDLKDSFGNYLNCRIDDIVYITDKKETKAEYTVDSFETPYTKDAILSGAAGEHLNWYLVPYKEPVPFGSARKEMPNNVYNLYIVGTGDMYNFKFPAKMNELFKQGTGGLIDVQEEVKDYLSENSVDFDPVWKDYMISTVYFSDDVTSIGDCAFIMVYTNNGPTGAVLSISFTENSKLESIGALSFFMEQLLEQFDIPQTVTSIGYGAVAECEQFSKVSDEFIERIPENCKYDPETLFTLPFVVNNK